MTIELTADEQARAAFIETAREVERLDPGGVAARGLYFDRDGDPIGFGTWVVLLARGDLYRRVGLDRVGRFEVSTVWLGLDHGRADGRREIFESMVFDGIDAIRTERYATEADARAGHARLVAQVSAIAQGGDR